MQANNYQFSPYTVLVSRVQRALKDSTGISFASCTNIVVADSYYEPVDGDTNTIVESWRFVTQALKGNAGVSVNLSKLRAKGAVGSQGLVAQGVTNFMEIYSVINAQVRRGNGFKNGAVNIALEFSHPDFIDFLEFARPRLPWAKKVCILDVDPFLPQYEEQLNVLLKFIASGRVFVYKQQFDKDGNKLEINVCQAIYFSDRATCLLAPVNLGMIDNINDIPSAFVAVAKDLNHVWGLEYKLYHSHFSDARIDKQAALGIIGLANILARFGVSYSDFTTALEQVVYGGTKLNCDVKATALLIAAAINAGYQAAGEYAKAQGYQRFFAVEPTANCSFNSVDTQGYTCTPEISPPVCHPETKVARRMSDDEYRDYQYPPSVEVAGVDVDAEMHFRLCKAWYVMQAGTGLGHGISYNWWLTMPVTTDLFRRWYESVLTTIYYRKEVGSANQDKTALSFDSADDGGDDDFFSSMSEEEEPEVLCDLTDKAACQQCGG